MKLIQSSDLTGLFGMSEMECAAARIVNIARDRGLKVEELRLHIGDFMPRIPHNANCERNANLAHIESWHSQAYLCSCGRGRDDQDGFRELVAHGWLIQWTSDTVRPSFDFVRRLNRRLPEAV